MTSNALFRKTLFLLACSVLSAGSARAETLETALVKALGSHPTLDAARETTDAAKEAIREKKAALFPDLRLSATGGRIYGDNSTSRGLTTTRGAGTSDLWEGSINVSQMLFDGFETYNRIDAAKTREDVAQTALDDARGNVALKAVQAYIGLLRAREALALALKHKTSVQDYVKRIKSMVAEGAADEAEASQAKDVLLQLDNAMADFEGQVRAAEAEYIEVVGSLPEGKLARPVLDALTLPNTADEAVQQALQVHPQISAALLTEKASGYELKAEESTLYPDFNGELSYMERDQRDVIGGESTDARAVVRMSWGFSTGGRDFAKIRRVRHEHAATVARKDETFHAVEKNVRLSYAELETAQKTKDLSGERVQLVRDLFKTYETQFEASKVTLLQLLQAKNQVFSAELERLNNEFRLLAAQYTAVASTGYLDRMLSLAADPAEADDAL